MNRLTRYHALAFMVLALLVAAVLRLTALTAFPPGVHYDEAAYGVNAIDIAFRGARPVFIPDYTGREPLFLYLVAGMMRLLGPTLFALRLTAAFIGLLTIAATYWLGREMLADRRVAVVASALLAVSFWHLLFSHLGFRVISQPLLQGLAAAALFRALRSGRWPWFWAAGVLIGLTAYTYLASRLFPFVLLVAAVPLLMDRDMGRIRLQQLLFTALVAFLTAMPLLAYFYFHPETFWTRISQVAPGTESLPLGESILRALGMFFLAGDPYLRFNLPGRPLFDFIWGSLLVVGWLFALVRVRRFPYDWQRAALLLLVATPFIMVLPTALAVNEIVPSNLRALGLIPFVFYLPAIGLITLLRDVERRFQRPPLTLAVNVVVLLVLISGLYTYDLYFHQWGQQRELVDITDGDLTAAASWLDQTLDSLPPDEQPQVYVASVHYRHPTLAFLSKYYDSLKWLPGSQALTLPASGPALYLYPINSPAPVWATGILEKAGPPQITADERNRELFRVYRLDEPPALDIPAPASGDLPANFGNQITLLGYEVEPAEAGGTLPVTLYWHVAEGATPPPGLEVFVHLEDAAGYRWSQAESSAYPSEQWAPGETIIQRVDLVVPPGTAPGDYALKAGLFDPSSGTRLPRVDEAGRYAGDSLALAGAEVLAGGVPDPLPRPPFPLDEPVTDGLRLLGYERGGDRAETGETGGLALWWLADGPLPPLSLRLSLVDEAGEDFTLFEGQPAYDTYAFEDWPAPAFVIGRQTATIPDDLSPGDYHYRASVLDATDEALYTADLGPVTVEKTDRVYDLPPVAEPVDALFGDEIRLAGYDLAEADGGYDLTLVWQVEAQPSQDYTVFVHLLYADGTCCAWQSDAMPRGGNYPTTRWRPGEVVSDTVAIRPAASLPPGTYPLEVGLYLAETGQRLPLSPAEPGQDAARLGPVVVR